MLTILEELKVDKVVICKQEKDSDNYQMFKEIVNKKKINVIVVKKRWWNNTRKGFKSSNFMASKRANWKKSFQ